MAYKDETTSYKDKSNVYKDKTTEYKGKSTHIKLIQPHINKKVSNTKKTAPHIYIIGQVRQLWRSIVVDKTQKLIAT